MTKAIIGSTAWVAIAAGCFAQKSAVTVQGSCNGSATGANITVIVNCDDSVSKDQAAALAKQYAAILKKIQQDHLAFDTVIEKLDSIQQGVDELKAATASRRLTPQQIQTLRLEMAGIAQPSEDLSYAMNDPEAVAYAQDFNSALALREPNLEPVAILVPGIGLHFFVARRYLSPVSQGLMAISRDIPPECMVIKLFLEKEHISFQTGAADEAGPGAPPTPPCTLSVGARPQ